MRSVIKIINYITFGCGEFSVSSELSDFLFRIPPVGRAAGLGTSLLNSRISLSLTISFLTSPTLFVLYCLIIFCVRSVDTTEILVIGVLDVDGVCKLVVADEEFLEWDASRGATLSENV